jgi:hypothetical protein
VEEIDVAEVAAAVPARATASPVGIATPRRTRTRRTTRTVCPDGSWTHPSKHLLPRLAATGPAVQVADDDVEAGSDERAPRAAI